jgi:hypothetical protein
MTSLVAVSTLLLGILAYAAIGFWCFKPIGAEALAGYAPVPQPPGAVSGLAVIAAVLAFGGVIFALGRLGHEDLQGLVWAGTGIAVLVCLTAEVFLPARCGACERATRRLRKRHQRRTPAIFHLTVCDHCRTYREELFIGLGEG